MYTTLRVRRQDSVCHIQLYRPEANNTINSELIFEFGSVLDECEVSSNVVIIEGLPEVFCFGADFKQIAKSGDDPHSSNSAERLFDIWRRLATGSFIAVAHVRGKVNAGGVGFVAACDLALADESAQFSLSELLFGVYPACVLPFLIRRIGFQRAHFLTLTTQPIEVELACNWGLVDQYGPQSEALVRKQLHRLRRLSKVAIGRYKKYADALHGSLLSHRALAVEGNKEVFSDPRNLAGIARFVEQGIFPWES